MKSLLVCLLVLHSSVAMAQTVARFPDSQWVNRLPGKTYYQGLEHYRNGNLTVATEAFESALASASKHENGLWIDAIPAHAMLGECYYHLGDLRRSISHVDAAIELFRRHGVWFDAINWSQTQQIILGQSDERAESVLENQLSLLMLPEQFVLDVSQAKLPPAQITGGLATIASLTKLDAIEIIRGAAVASYRRRMIVGSGSADMALSGDKQKSVSLSPRRQTEIARDLFAAVNTLNEFAVGATPDDETLEAITTIGGHIHPLTPLIYLAAARVAIEQDAEDRASDLAWGAAQSAAALGQTEYFAEAVVLVVRFSTSQTSPIRRQKILAASLSFLHRGRLAAMGALLSESESNVRIGVTKVAETMIHQVITMLQRSDIHQPRWKAHADYLLARVYASRGKSLGESTSNELDDSIASVLRFSASDEADQQQISSPKKFQLNRIIARTTGNGKVGPNDLEWLKQAADDPPPWLWKADPVDAISFASMDRSTAYQHQIRLAIKNGDGNEIVTACDALLRHRFLAQLPLGGRVQQVRNLASADPKSLGSVAAVHRKNASGRLKELIDRISGFKADREVAAEANAGIESLATEVALSPQVVTSTIPPPIQIEQLIKRMPANLSLLVYVDLIPETVAILVSTDGIRFWTIPNSRAVQQEVVGLLRDLGVSSNRAGTRMSTANDWPASAHKLCQRLVPPEQLESIRGRKQVVVVPDGVLWYVPFELLLNDEPLKLDTGLSITYSPTPGLAFSNVETDPSNFGHDVALVSGKLLAPNDKTLEDELFQQVAGALGDQTRMPDRNEAIEYRFRNTSKNIVVLDFLRSSPTSMSLINRGRPDPISAWMRLPKRVPKSIFLPGFQSGSVQSPVGDGRDLFFTVAALHCSGVEQVWISRWCVGGESTALLMSEILQELPYEKIDVSCNRAVGMLRRHRINPATEPLITGNDSQRNDIGGDHPLFWSGYLLSAPIQFD